MTSDRNAQAGDCCVYVSKLSRYDTVKGLTVLLSFIVRLYCFCRNVRCEHLEEIFGTYGAVERAEVDVDKRNGMSKGTAVVYFTNRKDADNAMVHLDGGQIDGCVIIVSDAPAAAARGAHNAILTKAKGSNVDRQKKPDGRVVVEEEGRLIDDAVDAGENRLRGRRERGGAGDRQAVKRSQSPPSRSGKRSNLQEQGKYVPKERSGAAAEEPPRGRARDRSPERGGGAQGAVRRVPSRSNSRRRPGAADSRGRAGERPAAGGVRRADSRERGPRGGAASHYGPASRPISSAPARGGGIYGPAAAQGRGAYVPKDRARDGRSPVRRSRSRSRDRRLAPRGARSRSNDSVRRRRERSASSRRSRSPSRSFSRPRRSASSSRSRSRSPSPRRKRRYSRSSSSSASSGGGRDRRARRRSYSSSRSSSYSRSARSRSSSWSRSRSRSRSASGSAARRRSVSQSRSRSRD